MTHEWVEQLEIRDSQKVAMEFQSVSHLCDGLERLSTDSEETSKSDVVASSVSSMTSSRVEGATPKTSSDTNDTSTDAILPAVSFTSSCDCRVLGSVDPADPVPWANLPDEPLLRVFELLDPLTMIYAASTCRRWRLVIANNQSLQRRKMKELNLEVEDFAIDEEDDDIESMSVDADSDDGEQIIDIEMLDIKSRNPVSVAMWLGADGQGPRLRFLAY